MKKLLLATAAVMLTVVATIPADAQSHFIGAKKIPGESKQMTFQRVVNG
jgi:hypothetical protein